jgi:hypothetical protein
MNINRNTKIFIGPHEIAGYYKNLYIGLKSLGLNVEFNTLESHPFGYGGESKHPFILKIARKIRFFKRNPSIPRIMRIFFNIPSELLFFVWGFISIFKYDVFIFGFGQSLLREGIDLPLLKILGKRVITNISHGSESRPAFVDGSYQPDYDTFVSIKFLVSKGKKIKTVVSRHFKYGNVVIGAPFSTFQYAQGSFINAFALGLPNHFASYSKKESISEGNKLEKEKVVRILHSPSNPYAKGTSKIIVAIENLKKKGYKIEFILIHGRPFSEVLDEIKKCDFVVDQIYSDTPLAGFATEAAWFGRPAVVGGYGLEKLKSLVPAEMWPPSKICLPDKVENSIEELIVDVEYRDYLGNEVQNFVKKKWDKLDVARRYLKIINGTIPENWWINPKDVVYFEGAGQSVEISRQNIKKMVSDYGVCSLGLSHEPELENLFLKFAEIQ